MYWCHMKIMFNKAKNDQWEKQDVAMAVIARFGTGGGNTPVVMDDMKTNSIQRSDEYKESDMASTIAQRDYKSATDLMLGDGGMNNSVVRRLTPLECERLQGFPDGWTDIGDWTDSNGKTHTAADSHRYKALGNSIATPFWFYLLRRISAQYERPATLGSLFDGIGGFPYCWEKCNGKGTAVWASEIEEFPIAVTKLRFPEE